MPEIPIPADIRAAVVRELYRQVGSLDWEELSPREKTRYYAQWVEDPAVGGELADYYTAEGMRVWLKDGPLKEYARAQENVGPFAQYATRQLTPASDFVSHVLGTSWSIVPGSIREKPMHCDATDGVQKRYACWGRPRTFRDLLWAAVIKAVESDVRSLIVVYTIEGKSVDTRLRDRHQRIAEHCRLDLAYVRRTLEDRSAR